MPTDRGRGLLGPPALDAEQAYALPVTGPSNLPQIRTGDLVGSRWEWDST